MDSVFEGVSKDDAVVVGGGTNQNWTWKEICLYDRSSPFKNDKGCCLLSVVFLKPILYGVMRPLVGGASNTNLSL